MLGSGDGQLQAQLRAERERLILRQTPIILGGHLLAAVVVGGVLLSAGAGIGGWLAALLGLLALRLFVWHRFTRARNEKARAAWRTYALLGSVGAGVLWGIGALWMIPLGGPYQLLLMLTLAGIAAGAAMSLAYEPPVLLAFLVACLGPLTVRLMQEGTLVHSMVGVLLLVYAGALMLIARTLYNTLGRAFQLQAEKSALAEELQGLLQNLEHKVAKRTEALRQTNTRLSREIEERQRAERAERAARAEAEQANAAKSRFLAAASHDLRQPLQGLHTYCQLLQRELTTPHQREIAHAMQGTIEANRQLLDALMQLSALESGSVQPHPRRVALPPLLQRVAPEYAAQADAKGLQLQLRLGPDAALAQVISDPVLLENILRNLIANALTHTRRGHIRLVCRVRPDMVRVEVWDTGPGIPPERVRAIFEEFYRLEDAAGEGLGLGLATVARLARLLGHEVRVRSRLGCGSCFALRLRRAPAPPYGESRSATQSALQDA